MSAVPRHQAWDGILATACGLAGRMDEARTLLERYAAQAAEQNGGMAEQSWRFVRAFTARFELSNLPFEIPDAQDRA
ncbi:hypothetical protein ACQP00_27690 [Dactylosporangium sp. CS-047395]|uniref:hypothetical protein n=1 Tax=Dactylosporangium sp. CS-047395 TaxID=3239936 RepID=UPI003D937071